MCAGKRDVCVGAAAWFCNENQYSPFIETCCFCVDFLHTFLPPLCRGNHVHNVGGVTIVGPDHHALSGTGDLSTIDTKRGLFFYLGDTSAGATLVGMTLTDGTEAGDTAQQHTGTPTLPVCMHPKKPMAARR